MNSLPLICLCIALAAVGSLGAATLQPAAASSPDPSYAIAQVLDDFHAAAAKADFERYSSHWTDHSVFLGTDATERWEGQQFRDFVRPYFSEGRGWTYTPRNRHISLDPAGQVAWFDELLDNDKFGECRGSGILSLQNGQWMILQYNLSIPIPNDMAAAETARIAEWKRINGK